MGRKLQGLLSSMMGDLGMPDIQVGSRTIKAKRRPKVMTIAGYGDPVTVGDIIEVINYEKLIDQSFFEGHGEPMKIFGIFKSEDGSPRIQYRTFDDGPLYSKWCLPLAREVETSFFKLKFRKVSPEEITAWFEKVRHLPDGWQDLGQFLGRVLLENGVPVKVSRAHSSCAMALAVERAGQLSGYDLVVSRTYEDPEKTTVVVKKATRRDPLKFLAADPS